MGLFLQYCTGRTESFSGQMNFDNDIDTLRIMSILNHAQYLAFPRHQFDLSLLIKDI